MARRRSAEANEGEKMNPEAHVEERKGRERKKMTGGEGRIGREDVDGSLHKLAQVGQGLFFREGRRIE